jgi:hypothetical protein
MSIKITNDDLYKNKYDYETLKTNIYAVSLTDILKTQILNADFCIKYILNEDFQFLDEDKLITMNVIKKYQPHIKDVEFLIALETATNKLSRGQRIDSLEDFESYMNRHL